jgi:MauM/NapG family ferredoxin protein
MPKDDKRDVDRRRFFRLGLSELLRPFAAAAAPLERMADQLGKLDQPPKNTVPRIAPKPLHLNVWLRPPGALPEKRFKETCSKCGDCVNVCPAQAIQIDPSGQRGDGFPFIDADLAACVVCTGLKCMTACPTAAIVPTSLNDIDMGTAVWKEYSCTRNHGDDCSICIDECPLGTSAIELKGRNVVVNPLGCIGCGVCQEKCPTSPKSISVIPIAAKTAGR